MRTKSAKIIPGIATKKNKTRAAEKGKRTTKATNNPSTGNGAIGHWNQWIAPKGAALLAEALGRVHFVIKNHGPNGVFLVAAHGDAMDLPSGAVRATYAHGTVRVENDSEDPVLVEFEFLPILLKP